MPARPETKARVLKSMEAPGRKLGRVAGGWISDLVALKKFITLCPYDVGKFNPRHYHYEPWRRDTFCVARCDACNQINTHCRGFIHESLHDEIGEPNRKRGRWASRGA